MGELLLCGRELASIPYYIETISLNVYSLEELCYYLKEYIDLVEISFVDEELIRWIESELKLPELSARLSEIREGGSGLLEFVSVIAGGCNYCTPEEIHKLQEKLAVFENKTEIECRKIRADRLLEKKRYQAAITAYKKLLGHPEAIGAFAGALYHNLGTAYAELFLFEDAAACYKKAYEKNQNPLSNKQRRAALQLAAGMMPHTAEPVNSRIQESTFGEWREAYLRSSK